MSAGLSTELTFEMVDADAIRDFQLSLIPLIFSDVERRGIVAPDYNNRPLCVAARTRDGRAVGVLTACTAHSELEVRAIAVDPDCAVAGVYTFLLQYVEDVARTVLECNRLVVALYDWQPRHLYTREGYAVIGTVANHPRGHTQYLLEKVWPAAAAATRGYAGAATQVRAEVWDARAATAQLDEWSAAEMVRGTASSAHPVRAREAGAFAFRGLHADGSLAAGIVCGTAWNVVHVRMLVVTPGEERRGVGTAMLSRLLEVSRERGFDAIALETARWQARPFYEKNGYTLFAAHYNAPPGSHRDRLLCAIPKS